MLALAPQTIEASPKATEPEPGLATTVTGEVEAKYRAEYERLACVGRMVSAVAHELNNRLTTVLGYTDLLIMKSQGQSQERLVRKLHGNTEALRMLTENLSGFSTLKKPKQATGSVERVLDQVADLVACIAKASGMEVELDVEDGLPPISLPSTPFRLSIFACADALVRRLQDKPLDLDHRCKIHLRARSAEAGGVEILIEATHGDQPLFQGGDAPDIPEFAQAISILALHDLRTSWCCDSNGVWRFRMVSN